MDFLDPLADIGYGYKLCRGVRRLSRAYADDISLITHTSSNNQKACDRTVSWLAWTITMAAKPRKCVSLGMKQFASVSRMKLMFLYTKGPTLFLILVW